MSRMKRLSELGKVPSFAAVDHRFFLNEKGEDTRFSKLTREQRRVMKAEGRRIGGRYRQILNALLIGGIGYPTDQFIRSMLLEYTNRYAASGIMNQPASFNYFESFCEIKLIENSTAPYTMILTEKNHLFSVIDFFDFMTSDGVPEFKMPDLMNLPDSQIYHFTQNGSISDFTYMTSEGREFLISGFSMVRRGGSLHWYVLGGELLTDAEWQARTDENIEMDIEQVPPRKRPFLSDSMKETGSRIGAPVPLEGTKTAIRTIVCGETDLMTSKHLARCYMAETENRFLLFCDDPSVLTDIEPLMREKVILDMKNRIDNANVMWNLAEGFFRLAQYFQYRISVSKETIAASGKSRPRSAKGGQGVGAQFKFVTSVEVSDNKEDVIRSYTPPYLDVETEGYWKRIGFDKYGHDREGNSIKGRTWVKSINKWRARTDQKQDVYIKSSVAAARIQVSEYMEAAQRAAIANDPIEEKAGVLYVMRCLAMNDEVYKVGWTSGTAEQRARELSSATGVPISFIVVDRWQHFDPEGLEKGVHAILTPYRIAENREFFKLKYPDLKNIIETEIERSARGRHL